VGGSSSAPANRISLQLDHTLIPQADPRPGKQDTTYHQTIVTSVVLRIETPEEGFQVTGSARFFLVRGDVPLIPAELIARGFRPDAARWYIQRWDDETAGSPAASALAQDARDARPLRAQPAKYFTWCWIKTLYR